MAWVSYGTAAMMGDGLFLEIQEPTFGDEGFAAWGDRVAVKGYGALSCSVGFLSIKFQVSLTLSTMEDWPSPEPSARLLQSR